MRLSTPRHCRRFPRRAARGRPQLCRLRTAPFFVIPVCAGITATMGGLMIDDHARVLTPDRKVISALYAAGTSFGGTDGGDVAGYVGGLIQAGVFGMLAAQDAAGQPS
ncbi:MAG: FAD-binding protein [Pseudolabrys sp.]